MIKRIDVSHHGYGTGRLMNYYLLTGWRVLRYSKHEDYTSYTLFKESFIQYLHRVLRRKLS